MNTPAVNNYLAFARAARHLHTMAIGYLKMADEFPWARDSMLTQHHQLTRTAKDFLMRARWSKSVARERGEVQ